MALQPEARLGNVARSLTAYFRTNLVTAEGLTVHFPHEPVTSRPAQWVTLDYLFGLRHDHGRTVGTRLGGRSHGLVNINLCQQRQALTNLYALATLRDQVARYVQPTQTIILRDYDTGGTPAIGRILVESVTEVDVDTGLDSGVIVQALSVAITHSEAYTLA